MMNNKYYVFFLCLFFTAFLNNKLAFCMNANGSKYVDYKKAFREISLTNLSLSNKVKAWLRGAAENLEDNLKAKVPASEVVDLYRKITSWNGEKALEIELVTTTNNIRRITVEKNSSGTYMNFGSLGEGSIKSAFRSIRFSDWHLAVQLKLTQKGTKDKGEERFENEKNIFKELAVLGDQPGIMKPLYVGESIYQNRYQELFDVLVDDDVSLSRKFRKAAIEKLTHGLSQIHNLGICVADIKLENTLVDLEKFDAVLSDFDLAYHPQQLIKANKNRPTGGSLAYIPPEMYESFFSGGDGWNGGKQSDTGYELCKGDVFALGMVIYSIIYQSALPWQSKCQVNNNAFEYYHCRGEELQGLLLKLSRSSKPADALIRLALNPNPQERISSKTLAEEAKGIKW